MIYGRVARTFLSLIGLSLFSSAFASFDEGFYVGGQVGEADTNYTRSNLNLASSGSVSNTGAAGRFSFGYQFNHGFGLETGFGLYPTTSVNNMNGTGAQGKINEYSIDIMAKGIIPFAQKWNLYGKIGPAFVHADLNSNMSNASGYNSDGEWTTAAAAGIAYDVTPNFDIDFSVNETLKSAHIQNITFYALGLSYGFANW